MSEDQNPADPVGDEDVRTDHSEDAAPPVDGGADQDEPTPETGRDQGDAPDAVAEDGEAGEKPDAKDGDGTPPAEDEKSRSALRRERRRKHLEEVEERARTAETALEAIRSAKDSDAEPKEGDFTDYTDYAAAKAVWALERRRTDTRTAEAQKAHEAAVAERNAARQAAWAEQVDAAKAVYHDFAAVAFSQSVPMTPAMGEVIMSSESGAALAYHLGTNVSEAARIAKLPPLEAARELGRIEANLSAPKPRTATKAPPPVRPVKPGGGTGEKAPGEMTPDQYRRWRLGG